MELFAIKDGKIVDQEGKKLPIAQVREILTAAVHTCQKAPLQERQKDFAKLVEAWSHKNPGKYPPGFYPDFIKFWTGTNEFKGDEKMKIELVQEQQGKTFTFVLGGRLATFWKNCDQATKNQYWAEQEKNNKVKQGSLL